MINQFSNIANLASKSFESLITIKGIGKDKAASLIAAFELGRRSLAQSNTFSDVTIFSPDIIANYFIPLLKDEKQENFYVINLNTANKIINFKKISSGTLNGVLIHPREVFKVAIENNAAKIIIMHNHPSGNEKPSDEDIELTKAIKKSGELIGIGLLDHIIIAEKKYFSFRDKNFF